MAVNLSPVAGAAAQFFDNSGNVLTGAVLDALKGLLPDHTGPWVVFGESCRLSPRRLAAAGMRFKQIPYEIKAR